MAGNLRKALFFFCLLVAVTLPFDFLIRETGINIPFIKSYQEVLILVVLFCWELLIFYERKIPFRHTQIDYPLAAFFAVYLFSSLFPSTYTIWSLKYTFRLFGFAVIFYAVLNFIDSKKRLESLLWALLAGAAAASLFAAAQYFLRQGEAANVIIAIQDFLEDITARPGRVRGPFIRPAVLACYTATLIPLAVSFLIWGAKNIIKKMLLLLITLLMAAALFLSGVAAGFIALTAGLTALFIMWSLRQKKGSVFVWAFVIALLLCVLMLFTIVDFQEIKSCVFQGIPQLQTIADRGLWKAGLDMMVSRPVKGWGADMFFWKYPAFTPGGLPYGFIPHYRSYNIFLEVGSATGIFGVIVFIWFVFSIFKTLTQNTPHIQKDILRWAVQAGVVSSLIVFFVHSQFNVFWIAHETLGLFWALIGIGACNIFIAEG